MTDRRLLLKAFAVLGAMPVVAWLWESWPLLTNLYSVAFENRRSDQVVLDIELAANGDRVYRSTVELDPAPDRVVLPCEWPRRALTYRLSVRLAGSDEWHVNQLRGEGRECLVTEIKPDDAVSETIGFKHTIPCPPDSPETHSCE